MLAELTIKKWPKKILVSKARRKKYYTKGKKIPKKYQHLSFNNQGFLVDDRGVKIIANPRSHGTPRYQTLSGNSITSGWTTPHMRNNISKALKKFYKPLIKGVPVFTDFPIRVEWDFYTTLDAANFDMSNFWFYWKYLEDTLVKEKKLPDDNINYISWSPGPKLIPVEKEEDRKFVFRFYRDDRIEITNHELWKKQQSIPPPPN